MVHSENSGRQENIPGDRKDANGDKQRSSECKILGDDRHSTNDKGTGRIRRSRRESFKEPDLTIEDEYGNEFRISVNKTPSRYYRLELFVNGHPITPMTFPGTHPMRSYWEMLKATFKVIKTNEQKEGHTTHIEGVRDSDAPSDE